jgi:hypothetical protein
MAMPGRWLVDVFIRRGALRRFDAFKRKTRELPVRVRWDRRASQGELPDGAPERRGQPPSTWDVADFVVVERAAGGDEQ